MRERTPSKSEEDQIAQVEIPLTTESLEYLKTKRETRLFMVIPLAQTYIDVLQQMRSSFQVAPGEMTSRSSFIPFVVTSAAALECLLNDNIIAYSDRVFGLSPKNRFANAFLSMSLRGKLDTIVPLLTSNKFVIQQESGTYQKLCRLIKLRNDLMHGKAFATEYRVSVQKRDVGGIGFPPVKLPKMPYDGIRIEDCDGFLAALREMNGLLSSVGTWVRRRSLPAEYQGLLAALIPRQQK